MKKSLILYMALVFVIISCSSEQDSSQKTTQIDSDSDKISSSQTEISSGRINIAVEDLAKWQFLGIGSVGIDAAEHAVVLAEGEDSKGVTIVSPESYGTHVTLTFKVKPLTYESVNVVMLSVSDKDSGGDIKVPAAYDGNFNFWTQENVQNYVFAFHNAAHDRTPFIQKSPGGLAIASAPENITGERWFDIEIARHGKHLIMKIDGKTVVEGTDPDSAGLPGGKICFRMRGTPGNAAKALFRDVVIQQH
ncbi:MAG: hypothetical protein JXB48_07440 [Candidatus Latescibacteria bacterium]|nr:hypothetical protein [Candidatus Latescibacterota bacterium]